MREGFRRGGPRREPSRRRILPWLTPFAVLLAATAATAAPPESGAASQPRDLHDFFAGFRLALVVAALLVLMIDVWARRRGRRIVARAALAALLLLGGTSLASYYFFFTKTAYAGFHATEVYHYYMGSRYFPELGYYGLYDCTVSAWDETKGSLTDRVRDLRSLRVGSVAAARARGASCPERFSTERWASFREDLQWFQSRVRPRHWAVILVDHGYHPSPVWGAVVGPLATRVSPGSPWMWWLLRADRGLVLATFGVLAWGFGLRIAALMAVVWGTGFLWGYVWVGDAFFRQLWFASAMAGLACLHRGRAGAAGALLAASTAMRLFPGAFLSGALIHFGRSAISPSGSSTGARRFLLGAAGAFVVLGLAGATLSERGLAVYTDFFHKVRAVDSARAFNKVGTGVLLDFAGTGLDPSDPRVASTPRSGPLIAVHVALILAAAALFLRAMGRVEDWEAACLGFAWIPLLVSPMSYYYTFAVAGLPLATRRPRIGVYVFLAALGWGAAGLWSSRPYTVASGIAVVLSLATLADVAFGKGPAPVDLRSDRASERFHEATPGSGVVPGARGGEKASTAASR